MLEQIPIQDNGEPLVDLRQRCPQLQVQARYTWPRQPTLYARAGAAERLNVAQERLSAALPGYRLLVVDAWRSPRRQRLFYRLAVIVTRLRYPIWTGARVYEMASRYVADPDAGFPPPHCTGGAIDVHLLDPTGTETPMGPRGVESAHTDYDRLSAAESANRCALVGAMSAAGFVNYEMEWWHWSYGDSAWASKTGHPYALYDAVESV
jgi:D-alanyl-D-alanine dipeptidase